jgi:hypothetical protein
MNERQLYDLAEKMAARYGVSPHVYRRMIQQESGFNPRAVNKRTGATGIAQVMSETARDPGFGVKPLEDRFDPVESLRFGAEYLAAMLNKFDGDYRLALAAYNAGPGTVEKAGGVPQIDETQAYVQSILSTQIPPKRPAGLAASAPRAPVPVPPPRPAQPRDEDIEPVLVPPPRPMASGPTRVPQLVARPVLTAFERMQRG